jgi:uncharacterized protein YwgA
MFLLSQRGKQFVGKDFYDFEPYLYGPYCTRLASDLDKLCKSGELVPSYTTGYRRTEYMLAPEGFRVASDMRTSVDARALDFVERTVAWVKAQTFSSLLASIYKWYPEYATKSIFKR